ncbi:FAD-binding protein [Alloprevotella sp. OH1205_COT-284]|uniref:NAD(P)/FAD-dependent oxidoreductase n=1 Tax=Alloprevotella sp. OH1205_COT-284 TaxID=2491043 RepID=UPI000F5F4A3F|nr:FAD-dependent monooxygenase [Alloprevotella sp. OH1205_COT-284]RRD78393.1 FAD-binding protein [Alloprevotella sp. OH1205_COT-284]
MITTLQLRVTPDIAFVASTLRRHVAQELSVEPHEIRALRPKKRSIDARQRTIFVNLTLEVYINENPCTTAYERIDYPDVSKSRSVAVVGAGPAGLFAALRLIELGIRPIVLERGRDVRARKADCARISREHVVDPDSNYAFGEGGAGAYSDGKLYTRSKKRGDVDRILRIFCQHGASTDILADAHPHIGTDRLPAIIEAMREQIKSCGGEVHFLTRVDRLLFSADRSEVLGVGCADGREFHAPVILAIGHSARDTYRYLRAAGVDVEQKGVAMGVRLEHPSCLIDKIQYHNPMGRGKYLPAAEYAFVQQVGGRGVYSFCMCPGGYVVPAATADEQLVVNGMSPSSRGGKWSNSGMVVETRPEDLDGELKPFLDEAMNDDSFAALHADIDDRGNPLRMMYLQEAIERAAWIQGGRSQCAPAQRMADFVNGRLSADLPRTSYAPGVIASPLHFWIPRFIGSRLREGFAVFGRRSRGFLTNEAVLIAAETRTSAPLRITRTTDTLRHIRLSGLYPCGEGAGYAGGIVSAAMDGERCAEAVAAALAEK